MCRPLSVRVRQARHISLPPSWGNEWPRKKDERERLSVGGCQPASAASPPLAMRTRAAGAKLESRSSWSSVGGTGGAGAGSSGGSDPATAASFLAQSPKMALRSSPPSTDSIEELFFATVGLVQLVAGVTSGARERYTSSSAMGGATTIGCLGFTTTDLFTTWGPPSIFAVQM